MQTYAIIIEPTNTIQKIEVNKKIGLEKMYSALEVSCIDIVQCQHPIFKDYDLVVDDEGLLKEAPTLNYFASFIAGQPLVGPVMICRREQSEDGIFEGGLTAQEANNLLSEFLRL